MKRKIVYGAISVFVFFGICASNSTQQLHQKPDELFEKIVNNDTLNKSSVESYLSHKFNGYNNVFQGYGVVLCSGSICAGKLQGKRNDTIFDIVAVFNKEKCIEVKENPRETFHLKGDSMYNWFMLGFLDIDYPNYDTTRLRITIEKYKPYKLNTGDDKFIDDLATVVWRDSLLYNKRENK